MGNVQAHLQDELNEALLFVTWTGKKEVLCYLRKGIWSLCLGLPAMLTEEKF